MTWKYPDKYCQKKNMETYMSSLREEICRTIRDSQIFYCSTSSTNLEPMVETLAVKELADAILSKIQSELPRLDEEARKYIADILYDVFAQDPSCNYYLEDKSRELNYLKDKLDSICSKFSPKVVSVDEIIKDIRVVMKEIQEEIESRPNHSNIGKKGCWNRLSSLINKHEGIYKQSLEEQGIKVEDV